ncbi:MAG: Fur family transcriptional regulator [Anaerolineae bacterium]|jgi:Fur family ferric uptake transcriptional regulator|nr:Fur family transcriptional regulator [Anaerolineae bacterium]
MHDHHPFIETLRQREYRITPQREMIIEAVTTSGSEHVTAEEIFEQVHDKSSALNIATVYRTLEILVEEGLISRADLGGGQMVYATSHHGPHIHLVCRYCWQVIDADYDLIAPFGDALRAQYGFSADLQHLAVFGVCATCMAALEE